jgi:hypothetical protein
MFRGTLLEFQKYNSKMKDKPTSIELTNEQAYAQVFE